MIEQSKEITEYFNTTNEIIEKQGKDVTQYLSEASNIMVQANNLYVIMITLLFMMTLLLLSIMVLTTYRMHKTKLLQQVKILADILIWQLSYPICLGKDSG